TQLRAVLSDPSIPEKDKSSLVAALFPKLDALAGRLLGGIIGSRWSDSDELVDGIESVGIRALAAAAGKDAGIEGELFAVGRAVASDHELELALGGKLGDPAAKGALVTRIIGKQANPATLAILTHLVQ
ncbi:hypothetical protein, partial [Vibrio cidicii]